MHLMWLFRTTLASAIDWIARPLVSAGNPQAIIKISRDTLAGEMGGVGKEVCGSGPHAC